MKPRQPLNNQQPDQYQNIHAIDFNSSHVHQDSNREQNMEDDSSPIFKNLFNKQSFQPDQIVENEVLNDDYEKPFKSYFSFQDYNKKFSNLAAIDCFATIYGQSYYQKTYQDQLHVEQLVGDVFHDEKPLNIDKLFLSHDSNFDNENTQQIHKNMMAKKSQESLNTMGKVPQQKQISYEDSMLMLSPDYYNQFEEQTHHCLDKLFEDPNEKQLMIKNNIAKSQIKKRKRLNSGVSNQSNTRSSNLYKPKYICNKTMECNSDLLKQFSQDILEQSVSLDFIQQTMQDSNIHKKLITAFEEARLDLRMEEPTRLLTRFGLNLVKILFSPDKVNCANQVNMHSQHYVGQYSDNLCCQSSGISDKMSVIYSANESNQASSQSHLSRKINNYKSFEDEIKLKEYINQTNKSISDLNDADLSELAQKMNMPPQQIYMKARRFQKEEKKRETQSQMSQDFKAPKRDIITRALQDLPNQRGTKKDILRKIEQIYNVKLEKNDSAYKTLEQALSKHFYKCPQEYLLNQNQDYSKFELSNNPGMKQLLIACLLQMKDFRGDIKQIKVKMIQLFGERIRSEYIDRSRSGGNLQEWERTLLKTISRHKDVFSQVKAVFSLQQSNNNSTFNAQLESESQIQRENTSSQSSMALVGGGVTQQQIEVPKAP
eukprot:403365347